jgi:Fe2+ transport system protein B
MVSRHYTNETQFPENIRDFILGFQTGIFIFLVCMLVIFIIRNVAAIANAEKLKKLYISETDERTLFIKQKTGSIGMNIILYGLIFGAVISGSIDYTIFLTLLGTCLFVAIVRGFLKLYYRNKF